MSIKRLLDRVPSAKKVDVGILENHKLQFHKISNKDYSAKCDAYETGNPEHKIHGVVFYITEDEKPVLDKHEGFGNGYEQKYVEILLNNGVTINAFTYYATSVNPDLKPLDWYKEHVLRGAIENELPIEYIRGIETIEHLEDFNIERRNNELSIYR